MFVSYKVLFVAFGLCFLSVIFSFHRVLLVVVG